MAERKGSGSGRRIVFRGAELRAEDVERIRGLVARHAQETRQDIARRASRLFGWREPSGKWAVSSCRLLLARLEGRQLITLPAPRRKGNFFERRRAALPSVDEGPATAVSGVAARGAPLEVRPVRAGERQAWRQDMARWHYLGDCNLVGESLRYVAVMGGQRVAWLGWAAAALRNGARDQYLGWDREQKARRLHLVVNNVRFLMLPAAAGAGVRASQVLAANVRRLSTDWQVAHGHRVLLAETFVDRQRFRGTCYRASNWLYVGETQGFSRRGRRYTPNGCPKAVFVYPLERHARHWLCAACWGGAEGWGGEGRQMLNVERIALAGEDGLLALLAGVIDPRKRRGIRHPLLTVLAISVCGILSGARSFAAIAQWALDLTPEQLHRFGSPRRRPPSEPTIRRVLQSIDAPAVDERLGRWTCKHGMLAGQALAIDGKTARGSGDGAHKPFHLVSAVVHGSGLVVAQQRVDDKTNEITSVEPLLEGIDLTGAVVTGDALFTQQKIARFVVEEKQADYLFMLKDNQPTLRDEIERLPREAFSPSGALHRRERTRAHRRALPVGDHAGPQLCGFPVPAPGPAHRTPHQ